MTLLPPEVVVVWRSFIFTPAAFVMVCTAHMNTDIARKLNHFKKSICEYICKHWTIYPTTLWLILFEAAQFK